MPKQDENGRYVFSYSQYNGWKRNKKEYIRSYFFGDRFKGNAYTDFGSKVGEALENNDFSEFDPRATKVLKQVTRLDEFERRIELDLGDFYVLGFIDTNNEDTIIDYKTGSLDKVAVYEADDYDQVVVYAAAMKQETGKMPKKAWVELIERVGSPFKGEPLEVGSSVVQIQQKISMARIKAVTENIKKVAQEVSDHYKVFLELNEAKI